MEKILEFFAGSNRRVVFAGIGNVLRNDDGVGPFIAGQIKKRRNWVVLIPESGIERYISAINRENPDLLVIFDCVEFGKEAGYWRAIPVDQVIESTLHSHNISLKKLAEFFHFETWVIGVQPMDISVGETLSQEVKRSAEKIISIINWY